MRLRNPRSFRKTMLIASSRRKCGGDITGTATGIGAGIDDIGVGAAGTGVTGDGTGTGAATGGEVPFATIFS
jgi:hypothetical protein